MSLSTASPSEIIARLRAPGGTWQHFRGSCSGDSGQTSFPKPIPLQMSMMMRMMNQQQQPQQPPPQPRTPPPPQQQQQQQQREEPQPPHHRDDHHDQHDVDRDENSLPITIPPSSSSSPCSCSPLPSLSQPQNDRRVSRRKSWYFVSEDHAPSPPCTSPSVNSFAPRISRHTSLGGAHDDDGLNLAGLHTDDVAGALDKLNIRDASGGSGDDDTGRVEISSGESDDDACMIVQGVDLGERDASDDDLPLCAPSSSSSACDTDGEFNVPEWLRGGMYFPGVLSLYLCNNLCMHTTSEAGVTPKKTPRKKSKSYWESLTQSELDLARSKVFGKALPDDFRVIWNPRLRTTAGLTVYRSCLRGGGGSKGGCLVHGYFVHVELSCKVVDSPERLRATLLHELCHVAVWVTEGSRKPPHGSSFKAWGSKVERAYPGEKVTTFHSYDIAYKFGRHSRSIDLDRMRCAQCHCKLRIEN